MYATGDLLGLLRQDPEEWFAGATDSELSVEAINELIGRRNAARAAKDFAAADALRDELAAAGVQIEDGPTGTTWRRA
jgi:cysteinyl-tRNA synthetase